MQIGWSASHVASSAEVHSRREVKAEIVAEIAEIQLEMKMVMGLRVEAIEGNVELRKAAVVATRVQVVVRRVDTVACMEVEEEEEAEKVDEASEENEVEGDAEREREGGCERERGRARERRSGREEECEGEREAECEREGGLERGGECEASASASASGVASSTTANVSPNRRWPCEAECSAP
eukprot:4512384-Pleurochrysis_carterae.AAC.2